MLNTVRNGLPVRAGRGAIPLFRAEATRTRALCISSVGDVAGTARKDRDMSVTQDMTSA